MPKHSLLPVESVQERDIDILLLEEFIINNEFASWFVSQFQFPEFERNINVYKSISYSNLGETDIYFLYKSKEKQVLVLIENKLDAPLQEKQYQRYLQRAEEYIQNKICTEAHCVLVAPEKYDGKDFKLKVSYEAILEQFLRQGNPRASFKVELLEIAIEKKRRGNKTINNELMKNFWKGYKKLLEDIYPALTFDVNRDIPQKATFIQMKEKRFKYVKIIHKFAHGNIDITFKKHTAELFNYFNTNLPNGYSLVKQGKYFALRKQLKVLDYTKGIEQQYDIVLKAISILESMHKYMIENAAFFDNYLEPQKINSSLQLHEV